MKKNALKKVILGLCVAASLSLTACGGTADKDAGTTKEASTEAKSESDKKTTEEKKDTKSEDKTEEKKAEYTAKEKETTEADEKTEEEKTSDEASEENGGESASEDVYAGISIGEAISNVKKQTGSGAEILNYYKGYNPTIADSPAWVIEVSLISASEEAVTDTYYVDQFQCFSQSSIDSEDDGDITDDEYAHISYSEAVTTVKRQAGSGAEILDVVKGEDPEGVECWLVTVMPVSRDDDVESVTYAVNSNQCYAIE